MISEQLSQVRELLLKSSRPYFLFDDDPDGLASFLLLYRIVRAGKGVPLKGNPLNEEFAEKVNNYQPDLVIILDKAEVEQEFLDAVQANIIWIDHHEVKDPTNVLYVNPRSEGNNIPTSALAYEVAKQDEWIATVGIVSDWQLPNSKLLSVIREQHPKLLPEEFTSAPEALFRSDVGKLARVFSFNLKGKSDDVYTSLKIFSRINNPYELLEEQHGQAKLVMKKYKKMQQEYDTVKQDITVDEHDSLLIYTYGNERHSFTTDLSNELLFEHPTKLIIIARQSRDSYKCSLRSATFKVAEILERVLEKVGGDGGGHEYACGAVVPNEAFSDFIEALREETKSS